MKNSFLLSVTAFVAMAVLVGCGKASEDVAVKQDDGTVMVFGQAIPVNYTPPSLVTGVDVPKLLAAHIPDFSSYKPGTPRPGYPGLKYRFTNRSAPYDKNGRPIHSFPDIEIGVAIYRSHREAVEGFGDTGISMPPRIDPVRVDDPGYLSWSSQMSAEKHGTFIRDNVLIQIYLNEAGDMKELMEKIDADLKAGQNGVTRGAKVKSSGDW